ncbi:MAG: AAA family ATPase [Candidatus Eremiobacteraeota bacterium]|nr:AAA family ATPase [Candidatus Eremiobacteraeota bacterium]
MRRLIFLLFLYAPAWARDLPPVLLLLNGTGSAGKSSIGRQLEKGLAHATFLSEEKLVLNAYLDILRQKGMRPHPPRTLAELMNYRASLPADVESSLRGEFRRRGQAFIQQDRRRQIELASRQGYDFIVLDNTLWKARQIEEWREQSKHYRAFHVVVYCPLSSLLEHVRARNRSPHSYEHRDLTLPLEMYFSMYLPTEARFVDRLEPEQLEHDLRACHTYQKSLKGQELDWRPYLRRAGKKIAPFFTYDLMVNTGASSTEACVAQIRAELSKRSWLPANSLRALPN